MAAPKIDYSWVVHLTKQIRRWQGLHVGTTNTMGGFGLGLVLGSGRADAVDHLDALDSMLRLRVQSSAQKRRAIYRYLVDNGFISRLEKGDKRRGGTAIPGGLLSAEDRTLPLFEAEAGDDEYA